MISWVRAALCCLVVTMMALPLWSTATSAQQATPPVEDQPQLFTASGVDAPILASADVDGASLTETVLLLERIELPAGASLPEHTAASVELLFVESGEVSIADNFGFTSVASAADDLILASGAMYTLSNEGRAPVALLRTSLAAGLDGAANQDDSPTQRVATPDPATSKATPVEQDDVEAGSVTTLADFPVNEVPEGNVAFFLAQATFAPGAESGEQGHAGPIALYIESGTLAVQSPSGLVGGLGEGQAVILPESAPLVASNDGRDEAIIFIVGVVAADGQLMAEVTPVPEPTPSPTPSPSPTQTPVPSPTSIPSPTPEPTATPEPTQVPTPTPFPTTAAGTVLQMGETWTGEGASLNVQVGDIYWYVEVVFTYRNLSDSRIDFLVPDGFVDVHDDRRTPWQVSRGQSLTGSRIILDPGESFQSGWDWRPTDIDLDEYSANVFITFRNFGAITEAKWGFTVSNGRILTIPPDAVDPVTGQSGNAESADSSSSDQSIVAAGSGSSSSGRAATIAEMLPVAAELPGALEQVADGKRSRNDIVSTFPDPDQTAANFEQWDWKGNVYRDFAPLGGVPSDPAGVSYVEVSIHRFGNREGGAAALPFLIQVRASQLGLVEVLIDPVGDQSMAVVGFVGGVNEATVYSRRGSAVIRVTVSSPQGDPLPVALEVTQIVLTK
jgi:quercetin dioxygenase-like cupin family protein